MSANRSIPSASLHDQMVRSLANTLWSDGWTNVRADLRGWPFGAPPLVGHFRPDVYAVTPDGTSWIFEVETSDSIGIAHTRQQWREFGHSVYRFAVLVPDESLLSAQLTAMQYGIDVDAWWTEP